AWVVRGHREASFGNAASPHRRQGSPSSPPWPSVPHRVDSSADFQIPNFSFEATRRLPRSTSSSTPHVNRLPRNCSSFDSLLQFFRSAQDQGRLGIENFADFHH